MLVDSSSVAQIYVEHVHFAILGSDVGLLVDDVVSQILLTRTHISLRVATEGEPHLVVKCKLLVFLEQMSIQFVVKVIHEPLGIIS